MEEQLNQIVRNSQNGKGRCKGCSAQKVHQGQYVNPGLGNPDGELIFVTEEPRHIMDWSKYETWREYNHVWWPKVKQARGGRFVAQLLESVPLTMADIWFTDSTKCPTKVDEKRDIPPANTGNAAKHCNPYLQHETKAIDPLGIVTLGKGATVRTLEALGIDSEQANDVSVEESYGHSEFDTPYPIVISLHWAQRRVAQKEWAPSVKQAIFDIVE